MTDSPDPRACRTPGANPEWWGAHASPKEAHAARVLCSDCVQRFRCLGIALDEAEPHGIWGGLDPWDRAQLATTLGLPRPQIRPPHGHRTRYVGTRNTPGCRCESCTAAHARYEHARRTGQLPEKEPLGIEMLEPEKISWLDSWSGNPPRYQIDPDRDPVKVTW